MKACANHRGFTLVEIMIVVLIIGILAMMARVTVKRINLRARASTYRNDCRVFSAAFYHYAQEKGDFPADQNGRKLFPTGMDGYLSPAQWLRVTPLGGDYDWDNKDATNSFGIRFKAAIRVNACTMSMTELQQIDRWIDDGNVSTGTFRVTDAGATVFYVMEQ